MFTSVSSVPVSSELDDYLTCKYPRSGGNGAVLRGTWTSNESFFARPIAACTETTRATVVRAFSVNGGIDTIWTVEHWQHDNGYHATFDLLSKSEFLAMVRPSPARLCL